MSTLRERVSYIQGLSEGLKVSENSKEGEILAKVVSLLEQVAEEVEDLWEEQDEIRDYLVSIDQDLSALEDDYYFDEDEEDLPYVEVTCPDCDEVVYFDEGLVAEGVPLEVTCPICGSVVFNSEEDYLDWEDEDDEYDGPRSAGDYGDLREDTYAHEYEEDFEIEDDEEFDEVIDNDVEPRAERRAEPRQRPLP